MSRPRRTNLSKGQLKKDAAARKHEAVEFVQRSSGVPLAMFGTCDPDVESKLVDDVVWQLLRHMDLDSSALPEDAPPEILEENKISTDDIRELIDDLDEVATDAPPDLLEHLPQERLWILLDLVREGSGLARQRATVELRDAMHHLRDWEGINAEVLRQLIGVLRTASEHHDKTVLFQALQMAAERALQSEVHALAKR